jgi:DNA-binding CsgD family transcriptional regulator
MIDSPPGTVLLIWKRRTASRDGLDLHASAVDGALQFRLVETMSFARIKAAATSSAEANVILFVETILQRPANIRKLHQLASEFPTVTIAYFGGDPPLAGSPDPGPYLPDSLFTPLGEMLVDLMVQRRELEFARKEEVHLIGKKPEPDLTRRQEEILALMCRGLSNTEIGQSLGIVERTVIGHVSHLLKAMDARSRTECVAIASVRFREKSKRPPLNQSSMKGRTL